MQIGKIFFYAIGLCLSSHSNLIFAQQLQGAWVLENFEVDLSQSQLSASSNTILTSEVHMMSERMKGRVTMFLQNDGTFINHGGGPSYPEQESKGTWRVSKDTLYLHPEHHLETGSHFSQQNELLKVHIPSVDQNQVRTFAIFRKVE